MTLSRYVVGIDLGTTNSALAYVDTGAAGEPVLQNLLIPQVVQPGVVEERPLLPSFLYLPGPGEQPAGSLKLPWAPDRDFAVGEFARSLRQPGADPAGRLGQVLAVSSGHRPPAAGAAVEGPRERPARVAAGGQHAFISSTSSRPGTTSSPRTWPSIAWKIRTSS